MRILIIGSDFKSYNHSIAYAFQELGHPPIVSSFKNPLHLYDSFLWRILFKSINKLFNGYLYNFIMNSCQNYNYTKFSKNNFDMILFIRPDYFSQNFLKKIKSEWPESFMSCWIMDAFNDLRNSEIEEKLKVFDHVFYYNDQDQNILEKINKSSSLLRMAYDDRYYVDKKKQNKKWKICFVGSLSKNRLEILESLIEALNLYEEAIIIAGHNQGIPLYTRYKKNKISWLYKKNIIKNQELSHEEVCALYNNSEICINAHQHQNQGINPRFFEIAGSGAFQLLDLKLLSEDIIIGRDIIIYDGVDDLISKVSRYKDDENLFERNRVSKNLYQKVSSKHTFKDRALKIINHYNLRISKIN